MASGWDFIIKAARLSSTSARSALGARIPIATVPARRTLGFSAPSEGTSTLRSGLFWCLHRILSTPRTPPCHAPSAEWGVLGLSLPLLAFLLPGCFSSPRPREKLGVLAESRRRSVVSLAWESGRASLTSERKSTPKVKGPERKNPPIGDSDSPGSTRAE